MRRRDSHLACAPALLLASLAFAQASATSQTPPILTPTGAKDTAIWVHPTDRSQSLVFGTDQLGASGLFAYGLDGGLRAQLPGLSNTVAVDVRYGIALGTALADVVLAVNPNGTFHLLSPDPLSGALSPVDASPTPTGSNASAGALHKNPGSGALEVFIADTSGKVRHYRTASSATGKLVATLLRTVGFAAPVQGLAADDRSQRIFLTLSNRGLFVLPAAESGAQSPTLVDSIDAGRLAGAEGVALYFTADGGGYLIASASQASRFPVYSLATGFPFVASFAIVAGGGINGTLNTRGIAVTPASLGAPFAQGLFVAHDNAQTNYKLVGWDEVAQATTPALAVDTRVDPRGPGPADAGSCPDAGCPSGTGGGGGKGGSPGGVGGILPPAGGGGGFEERKGCGCAQAGWLVPLAGLGWLIRRRRTGPAA